MNDMNDIENESISKALEEALKSFDSKTKHVPAGYFDQFELNLIQKITGITLFFKYNKSFFVFLLKKRQLVLLENVSMTADLCKKKRKKNA